MEWGNTQGLISMSLQSLQVVWMQMLGKVYWEAGRQLQKWDLFKITKYMYGGERERRTATMAI